MIERILTQDERNELWDPNPVKWGEFLEAIAKAQDVKTLKAVGVWLEKHTKVFAPIGVDSRFAVVFTISNTSVGQAIQTFKQGKMPEETIVRYDSNSESAAGDE